MHYARIPHVPTWVCRIRAYVGPGGRYSRPITSVREAEDRSDNDVRCPLGSLGVR